MQAQSIIFFSLKQISCMAVYIFLGQFIIILKYEAENYICMFTSARSDKPTGKIVA